MERMTFKLVGVVTVLNLIQQTKGGLIQFTEEDALHHYPHVSVASSYMHFRGPVEGPEFEVKVPYVIPHAEHNHYHGQDHDVDLEYKNDYVAHPKYEFSYGVEDHHTGDFHSQKETRDGSKVSGEYTVKEPGGGVRVVRYHADKDGFHAVVHNSGKNDHSGGTYEPQSGQIQAEGHEELSNDRENHGYQDYASAASVASAGEQFEVYPLHGAYE